LKTKNTVIFILPFALITIYFLSSFTEPDVETPSAKLVKGQFKSQCDSFSKDLTALNRLITLYKTDTLQLTALRERYIASRIHFKRVESLMEYYFPATAKLFNGALVNESDEEEGTQLIIEPEGLQVVEDILFSDKPHEQISLLETHGKRLLAVSNRLNNLSDASPFGDFQIMDAQRMALIRIMTLSIIGFDSPASGNALKEIEAELESIRSVIACYEPVFLQKDKALYQKISKQLEQSMAYLKTAHSLDELNKYVLIRQHLDPLYASLTRIMPALNISVLDLPSPIRLNATSIFSKAAINTNYYNPYNTSLTKEAIQLGKILFFDPVLSGNNKRACASCHDPKLAFTDNLPTSKAFGLEGTVSRNAPTIINAGFQANYFYDSRSNYLEDQIRAVTNNQHELHGDLLKSAEKLKSSPEYVKLFKKAYKGKPDTVISILSIIKAISSYERSLVAMDSKFDQNIRREKNTMTKEEISGFNLFMGKAECATCHFMPMFNGTVPPAYTKTEWEILGVPTKADTANAVIDTDPGRFAVNGMELNKYAFKTTTLRNVALTAPYMHNGIYKTLEEVVDFYARGGGNGIGLKLETQTLPFDKLELSAQDRKDLVSFLKTLTDTVGCTAVPQRLPAFPDKTLNKRKIGGEY
jgi:cytochrome c peroxidase